MKHHLLTATLLFCFTLDAAISVLQIAVYIRIDVTLQAKVFIADKATHAQKLLRILQNGEKLERWSQLETLVSLLQEINDYS